MIDLTSKSPAELKNLLQNYQKQSRSSEPVALAAQAELSRRQHGGLNFDKSMELIKTSAKARQFLSYKALAEQSGASWGAVRYKVFEHLGQLVTYAHHRGWPLLSAIVVNAEHVQTGGLTDQARAGFVKAARELGYEIGADEMAFVRLQQDQVFTWAETAA